MERGDIEHPFLERIEDEEECGVLRKSWEESKTLWMIGGPVMFTMLCQFSMSVITQTFLGHVGTIEMAAFSLQNADIGGLIFGVMVGMGSALETLCGQAYGAGKLDMLGVYMQRSWIILTFTAILFLPVCIFASPILKLLGQDDEIADLAGKVAIWMIPQSFSYAFNFPNQKFLQAQSKVMVVAFIFAGVCALHIILSWLFILKLGWGLLGAALVFDFSLWLLVIGQFVYIISGACHGSWNGLSRLAFKDVGTFLRLSMSSAIMLCLEIWYFNVLVLLAGHLSSPEIAVDAISICLNINGWEFMVPLGLNAAISVRVSNELGAGRPNAAKFSILVVTVTSLLIGFIFSIAITFTKDFFPSLFTNSTAVMKTVEKLASLLSVTILFNSIQPVLSGVAIGAGWQASVAYVNIGSYYLFGIPLGCLLGYYLNLGTQGIWIGMIGGTALQTIILVIITFKTDWRKEASEAEDKIRKWGGVVTLRSAH